MKKLNNINLLKVLLIFFFSLIVYHLAYGLHTILPSNTAWLMEAKHDWGQHYLGWAFFRNDDWTFPLGSVNSWYYPMGTNVGLTDSIPLFALFFKLFDPILGNDFQYFGFWIFSCFFLNGFFTQKILNHFKINFFIQLIVILFVITNPVLIYRGLHPALCGQWLIIASIYFYIKQPTTEKESYKTALLQGGLILLSGLIHPYLTFIISGFALIIPFKNYVLYYKTNILKSTLILASTFILLLINWYVVGLIGGADSEVKDGYGLYSWNFNSFFNGDGFSSIFAQMDKENPRQYEGYSYLGAGMFIAIIIALITILFRLFKTKFTKNQILIIAIFGIWVLPLTIFGISNVITYNDQIIFTYPVPEIVTTLGNIFRATSRFIWLLYYAIFIGSLVIIAKINVNKYIKIIGLGLIFILQIYDIKTLFTFRNLNSGEYHTPLTEEKWNVIFQTFNHVITYPIYDLKTVKDNDYQDFGYLAAYNHASITNAYVARTDAKGEESFRKNISEQILNNSIDTKTVYIVGENNLGDFVVLINSGNATLKKVDDYFIIYSSQINLNITESEEEKKAVKNALKTHLKPNRFELTSPIKPTKNIDYNFEKIEIQNNYINISGWGAINTSTNNLSDSIFVVLHANDKFYIAPTKTYPRGDIAEKYNSPKLENAGFTSIIFTDKIKKGTNVTYGLLIKSGNYLNYVEGEEVISIGIKINNDPISTQVQLSKNPFILSVDKVEIVNNRGIIFGWTALENIDNKGIIKEVILEKDKKYFSVSTKNIGREDVVSANPKLINVQNCGFVTDINIESLQKGKYNIGIRLHTEDKQQYTQMSDKSIIIK